MGFFFTYFGVLVCRQTYTLTDPTPFTRPRATNTATLSLQYNRYYRFVMQYAEPKPECRRRQSNAHLAVVDGPEDGEHEEGQDDVHSDLQAKPNLGVQRKSRGRPLK